METLHQPNDIIDQRYRIVTPLGQGSMGTTYEAEDLTSYQRVAIKAVSLRQATDWKILELFEREGRVLANLNHPNIPNYLDYFYVDSSQDRIFYLVRELVAGDSLANLVQRGWHLDEKQVEYMAIQVLQTLDYLHRLNPPIIHRDIKPENLIVDRSGKVFLVDFGSVADVYRQTISSSNTFVGTLGYMAPEQLRSQVKPASDLYSLGATLVFILTGRSPVDLPQIRMKIDFRNRVSISPQFARWLDKMLEPMLEDRFSSVKEALDALEDNAFFRQNGELIESDRASSNTFSTRRRQPAGSKIVLTDNGRDLLIEIPNTKQQRKSGITGLIMCLAGVAGSAFLILLSLFVLRAFFLAFIFFILFVICILSIGPSIRLMSVKTILKVNADKLCLECISGGSFVFWSLQILTSEIEKIELLTINGGHICTIWQGVKPIHFGWNLSHIEQEWLVEEINYFLKQIGQ